MQAHFRLVHIASGMAAAPAPAPAPAAALLATAATTLAPVARVAPPPCPPPHTDTCCGRCAMSFYSLKPRHLRLLRIPGPPPLTNICGCCTLPPGRPPPATSPGSPPHSPVVICPQHIEVHFIGLHDLRVAEQQGVELVVLHGAHQVLLVRAHSKVPSRGRGPGEVRLDRGSQSQQGT